MQDYLVASGGMLAAIGAVEWGIWRWQALQIDQPGDTLGLVVDAIGFVLGDMRVLPEPSRVPMLDLDHEYSLGADDDLIDLVGKAHGMAGMADIGEQHPRALDAL